MFYGVLLITYFDNQLVSGKNQCDNRKETSKILGTVSESSVAVA